MKKKQEKTLFDTKVILYITNEGDDRKITMAASTGKMEDIAFVIGNALSEICREREWDINDFIDMLCFGTELTEDTKYGK